MQSPIGDFEAGGQWKKIEADKNDLERSSNGLHINAA